MRDPEVWEMNGTEGWRWCGSSGHAARERLQEEVDSGRARYATVTGVGGEREGRGRDNNEGGAAERRLTPCGWGMREASAKDLSPRRSAPATRSWTSGGGHGGCFPLCIDRR